MLFGELEECVDVFFVVGPKEMQQGLHLNTVVLSKWAMKQRGSFDSRELPEVSCDYQVQTSERSWLVRTTQFPSSGGANGGTEPFLEGSQDFLLRRRCCTHL